MKKGIATKLLLWYNNFITKEYRRFNMPDNEVETRENTERERRIDVNSIRTAADLLSYFRSPSSPIRLKAICDHPEVNLKIIRVDFSSLEADFNRKISGMLFIDETRRYIMINKKDVPQRQRFTIAHELAHFFLHHDKNSNQTIVSFRGLQRPSEAKLENEADQFAAELLMPEDLLRKEYEIISTPLLSQLAKKFDVSKTAMKYRLDILGLDCILI